MSASPSDIVARLEQLALLGRYAGGIDRGLATPAERAAREQFAAWARADGFALTQDAVGNLFARRNGTGTGAPILVGSHLDTVRTGGAYDGAYGVAGALCALAMLNRETSHGIEAVAWAGEEGSRFPLGCLGSSVFAGLTPQNVALELCDDQGISLRDALASKEHGLLPHVPDRTGRAVAAYLELHVEQGPVLEAAGMRLGVVTAIAAQRRYRVAVEGTSGHAGTVPMDRRSDALCAAAELIAAIERAARETGEAVATVGRLTVEPNGSNVIPGRVTFSIDARSPEDSRLDAIERALQAAIQDGRRQRGVRVTLDELEARPAAPMDPALRAALHRACATLQEPALDVASGAGHDAMCLSRVAPTAMLFVPSIGGLSHVGQERTAERDLQAGVAALAAAIVEVDRVLGANG